MQTCIMLTDVLNLPAGREGVPSLPAWVQGSPAGWEARAAFLGDRQHADLQTPWVRFCT